MLWWVFDNITVKVSKYVHGCIALKGSIRKLTFLETFIFSNNNCYQCKTFHNINWKCYSRDLRPLFFGYVPNCGNNHWMTFIDDYLLSLCIPFRIRIWWNLGRMDWFYCMWRERSEIQKPRLHQRGYSMCANVTIWITWLLQPRMSRYVNDLCLKWFLLFSVRNEEKNSFKTLGLSLVRTASRIHLEIIPDM